MLRRLAVLCLGTPLLGCPALPEPEWSGQHITFAADHPEQVCGGTRAYLDEYTGQMLDKLGSGGTSIEYFWLDDVSDHCPPGAVGCGEAGVVFSQWVPHLHELVHARDDAMPRVLDEGLATRFGDPYPAYEMAPRERLLELLTTDPGGIDGSAEYSRAAHFIAFLQERNGLEHLVELSSSLTGQSSVANMDAAFELVYGAGLDAIIQEYADYPDCAGNVDVSIQCDGDVVYLDALQSTIERQIDCSASDIMGPYGGWVFAENIVDLAPAIDGSRMVAPTGDGASKGGVVMIRRCAPCSEGGVLPTVVDLGFVPEEDLPAGRYVVQFYLPAEAGPASLGVYIGG